MPFHLIDSLLLNSVREFESFEIRTKLLGPVARYASQNEILVLGSQDEIVSVVLGTGLFHLNSGTNNCEMVVGSRG